VKVHVAAESEAAFPSVTAERIGNLVQYTTNREVGRVAKKRVTFRRRAGKQGRIPTPTTGEKTWRSILQM